MNYCALFDDGLALKKEKKRVLPTYSVRLQGPIKLFLMKKVISPNLIINKFTNKLK